MQEVSGVYTSSFLDTDDLKKALRARKVSAAFQKRTPVPSAPVGNVVLSFTRQITRNQIVTRQ